VHHLHVCVRRRHGSLRVGETSTKIVGVGVGSSDCITQRLVSRCQFLGSGSARGCRLDARSGGADLGLVETLAQCGRLLQGTRHCSV
jgi:hypothetical protein